MANFNLCYTICIMSDGDIGIARLDSPLATTEGGALFHFPYGESTCSVALNNEELDEIFSQAARTVLKRSIPDLDLQVPIQSRTGVHSELSSLPLFIGGRSFSTDGTSVHMDVAVVTQSVRSETEHRGVLSVERQNGGRGWRTISYAEQSPIDEPHELADTPKLGILRKIRACLSV